MLNLPALPALLASRGLGLRIAVPSTGLRMPRFRLRRQPKQLTRQEVEQVFANDLQTHAQMPPGHRTPHA